MKYFFLITISTLITIAGYSQYGRVDNLTKEFSFKSSLGARPYMFYGYSSASSSSEKLIFFSTYPSDIAENKLYHYPLGAYHETTGLKDGEKIIYTGTKNGFAEMKYIDSENKETVFYIRRGFVRL